MILDAKRKKKGGRHRQESRFLDFRNFIAGIRIGEIKFKGEMYTWENNREGKGFIQERLDKFFGSAYWIIQRDTTEKAYSKTGLKSFNVDFAYIAT